MKSEYGLDSEPAPPLSHCTYHRAGSTNQSPSHCHPRGGRKYSRLSFTFPVTSENLWRLRRPVVPHLPRTKAWFSYCRKKTGDFAISHSYITEMKSLSEKRLHHFSINAEVSLWVAVELFLLCRKAEPHVDPQLNGDLQPFIFVHWVLINKKEVCSPLKMSPCSICKYPMVSSLYLHEYGLGPSTVFATGLFAEVRVQDLVCWNSGISYPLLSSQHPDDHIRHAVLRLIKANIV